MLIRMDLLHKVYVIPEEMMFVTKLLVLGIKRRFILSVKRLSMWFALVENVALRRLPGHVIKLMKQILMWFLVPCNL
jgi:hypothetical protein